MKKSAVVFQSKYGATKKYAEWIAAELSCPLFEKKSIKVADLSAFDTIIYGGGLYAGGVAGVSLLTKNFESLKSKNLVLFTCGLGDPANAQNAENISKNLDRIFTPEMRGKIRAFSFRGAMDYKKLSPLHRAMMAMVHRMTAKKDAASRSDEDNRMLETYGKSVDFTDKSAILPLIEYVRKL